MLPAPRAAGRLPAPLRVPGAGAAACPAFSHGPKAPRAGTAPRQRKSRSHGVSEWLSAKKTSKINSASGSSFWHQSRAALFAWKRSDGSSRCLHEQERCWPRLPSGVGLPVAFVSSTHTSKCPFTTCPGTHRVFPSTSYFWGERGPGRSCLAPRQGERAAAGHARRFYLCHCLEACPGPPGC